MSYCSVQDVEAVLGFAIDGSTHPNETEMLIFAEAVDAEIDARILSKYHVVSGLFDVPPIEGGGVGEGTVEWMEYLTGYGYEASAGAIVVPDLVPIVSVDVSGCHRRTTGLGSVPTWEVLEEGFDKNFLVLKKKTKTNEFLGFALFFFENPPLAGVQTLRLSMWYGYDIDPKILRKYATKRVAIEVLKSKMGRNEPAGLTQFRGGDFQTFTASNFADRIKQLETECEWLEQKFFPDVPTGVSMAII